MSFVLCSNFDRTPSCPICCENFEDETHHNALVHKDALGREVHPIHDNCLQDLLRSSRGNANTPPKCPLCRERITHVNGEPVQRIQRPPADASMDPLTRDAIGGMRADRFNDLPYRRRENERLLSRRFLQSLIPGRIEYLQRRNSVPLDDDFLLDLQRTAAQEITSHRNGAYGCICLLLGMLITIPYLLSLNFNMTVLIMGILTAMHGFITKIHLEILYFTVSLQGPYLFPTEAD